MFCGVYKDFLILRIGETSAQESFELPYVKPFDITGRAMKGWIMIDERGFESDDRFEKMANQGKTICTESAVQVSGQCWA